MIISEAKITSKRQITVPVKVMERLKIKPGDMLVFEQHGGHIEIMPSSHNFSIDDFIKKYARRKKIKLSQKQINKAKKEAWGRQS